MKNGEFGGPGIPIHGYSLSSTDIHSESDVLNVLKENRSARWALHGIGDIPKRAVPKPRIRPFPGEALE